MARKKPNIHYTYKTTCLVTGRYYIGMHSTCNLEDGYMGSGKRLRHSIRKYGVINHKKEIIEFFGTRELLVEAEKKAITLDMITDNNCMNLKEGGSGGLNGLSKAVIKKISIAGNNKIKQLKEEDIQWWLEITERRANTLKKSYKSGKIKRDFSNRSNLGLKHKQETKDKIGKTNSIKQKGENNSQYGTCWITKEGINKKIKKEEIKIFNSEGWIKGRK